MTQNREITAPFPTPYATGYGESRSGLTWQTFGGTGSNHLSSLFSMVSFKYSDFFMNATFFLLHKDELKDLAGISDIITKEDRQNVLNAFNERFCSRQESTPNNSQHYEDSKLRLPTEDELRQYFFMLKTYNFNRAFVFREDVQLSEVQKQQISEEQQQKFKESKFLKIILNGENPPDLSPKELADTFKDHPFVAFG